MSGRNVDPSSVLTANGDAVEAVTTELTAEQSAAAAIPAVEETITESTLPVRRLRHLSTTRVNSWVNIPSAEDDLTTAAGKWSEGSWQMKMLRFLQSHTVEKLFICLLLMDVLILFTELAIDGFFPTCKHVVDNAISCCSVDDTIGGGHQEEHHSKGRDLLRFLGGSEHDPHGHSFCTSPLVETGYEAGCDPHKHPGVHAAHSALFWTTVAILASFEIELLMFIYLLGPRQFFQITFYVVDFFIVTISLVLELVFKFALDGLEVLPGILVIFRVWRFVRIGHGLIGSTYELQEQTIHLALEHLDLVEGRLRRLGEVVPERPSKLKKHEDHRVSDPSEGK